MLTKGDVLRLSRAGMNQSNCGHIANRAVNYAIVDVPLSCRNNQQAAVLPSASSTYL